MVILGTGKAVEARQACTDGSARLGGRKASLRECTSFFIYLSIYFLFVRLVVFYSSLNDSFLLFFS